MSKEILSMRLNTIHNIHFFLDFFKRMRDAIGKGSFENFREEQTVVLKKNFNE
jgi:queuine tRNA-ribosyltransferase